jgi:signal transduction histidine kinase/DNA-binding response OmpR family regulator
MSQKSVHPIKATILAVDDTPANLHLLAKMLSNQGYKLRIIPDCEQALNSAQADPPDLILLDILMPQMDGYEICSLLKADERTQNIPIIFISALNEGFDKVKAFEVGGVDYITKPFIAEEVIARVENQLRLRAFEKQLLEQNARLNEEIEERKQREDALQLIVEGTASTTGDNFMRSCVRYLAEVLQVRYALIAQLVDKLGTSARTLAFWTGETWSENFEYELADTPCVNLLKGKACLYPQDVQALFPKDRYLVQLNAASYFGSPLFDSDGKIVGLLVVLDTKPMAPDPNIEMILKIFAARAGAELERIQAEEELRRSEAREREKAIQLELTLRELRRTQSQLIQAEKLSSLGQMVAGVAHEINNPVSFIFGNLTYARSYFQDLLSLVELYQQTYFNPTPEIQQLISEIELDFLAEDWSKLMYSMQVGAERIQQIVQSLKLFSRLDESELKLTNIHESIDNTLLILQHRLRAVDNAGEIEVIKNYGQLPLITCYASQLNQVFMNLLNNAIDALSQESGERRQSSGVIPTITIRTEVSNQKNILNSGCELLNSPFVVIRIADNGAGISEEVQQKIFDPFFTTKPVGSGTGLGLSISHQIVVEKHKGHIRCVSAPGQGTEFIVEIPVSPKHSLMDSCHFQAYGNPPDFTIEDFRFSGYTSVSTKLN